MEFRSRRLVKGIWKTVKTLVSRMAQVGFGLETDHVLFFLNTYAPLRIPFALLNPFYNFLRSICMSHKPMFIPIHQNEFSFALPAKVAACVKETHRDRLTSPNITERGTA